MESWVLIIFLWSSEPVRPLLGIPDKTSSTFGFEMYELCDLAGKTLMNNFKTPRNKFSYVCIKESKLK